MALPPLSQRMRPKSLDQYVGQQHLVGAHGVLRVPIARGAMPSCIFWGPPGVGKTTLAEIIADTSKKPFKKMTAINAGVKDVRKVIDEAKQKQGLFQRPQPILFIDEIHRFNKSQQDALLEAVEKGLITLIGATTENPSFEVVSALLSRCQVYNLNPLGEEELTALLKNALQQDVLLSKKTIEVTETQALFQAAGGDGRRMLNLLELLVEALPHPVIINDENVKAQIKYNPIRYDKAGEQHYDIVAALIKSVRGSDPNAAVYWLARMLVGGEDVKFIARRLLILASEDIGLANPTALVIANSTFEAVDSVGMPEARIILSQCAVYLANSPKSNSCYTAIDEAIAFVKQTGNLSVPLHLRNAPTDLMKSKGYGKDYQYAHHFPDHFINQEFLPEKISGTAFYKPAENPKEAQAKTAIKKRWGEKYGEQ